MLMEHRGLWWCSHCGAYTTGAKGTARLLAQPCGQRTRAGKQNLDRLAKGMPPKDGVQWPHPAERLGPKRKAELLEEATAPGYRLRRKTAPAELQELKRLRDPSLQDELLDALPKRRLLSKTSLSLGCLAAGLDDAELEEEVDAEAFS